MNAETDAPDEWVCRHGKIRSEHWCDHHDDHARDVQRTAQHAETDALLEVVPTIKFGRQRTLHGVKVGIDGKRVYLATRCGIRTDEGEGEYTSTHGVVTCDQCTSPPGSQVEPE